MNTTDLAESRAVELRGTLALPREATATGLVVLFASTLFASAFLLFLVQPMVAKMVLPILGGSPMVWNACMVFFQIALLGGYAYAHGVTRWMSAKGQVALHVALLMLPFAVLPVIIQGELATPPAGNPVFWLLLLLAGTVGLPFFVLSTSASIFQHWFSRTGHTAARDPYFLYVASNVGSFLALGLYPAVVEPELSLGDQSRLWTIGYALFVLMAVACAIVAWRGTSGEIRIDEAGPGAETEPLTLGRRARWIALAFVPSSLMLAVTTYLSTDIASVPLMWVVPLALYLLTFVVAFSARGRSLNQVIQRAFPIFVVALAVLMSAGATKFFSLVFPLHLMAFVAAALLCHGQLAEDRPAASHLTEFYLWVSVGGMAGGLFNTLLAPVLFTSIAEYPIGLVLACLMLAGARWDTSSARQRLFDLLVPAGIGVAALAIVKALSGMNRLDLLIAAMAVPAVIAFSQRRRPMRFAASIAALLLVGLMFGDAADPLLYAERTFFGVYRVNEDRESRHRALTHGTTLHGVEALEGAERGQPLTYYHRQGPFGQAFAELPHAMSGDSVAVIGLGIGTLGSYAQPAQHWTFYEIDPAVERIARDSRYFTFLERCGTRCTVVDGDARLSLARDHRSQFDLLVLDAFSSDSIPMHLLTTEALDVYLSHLKPGGAILFHISNRHLALAPIVARLAEDHHLVAYGEVDRAQPDWPAHRSPSTWAALARGGDDLGGIRSDSRWAPLAASPSTPLWTDDFSNILSVLALR